MRPLIGIPPCLDDRGRLRAGRRTHYLDHAYVEAVAAAGGAPVLLPGQADAAELARRIDGLLVPGGDDFLPPSPYPERVHFEPVSDAQLEFDRRLLAAAREADTPILGICYGMQLLALQFGGSLLFDIPTDAPDAAEHALAEAGASHPIVVERASKLAGVLGDAPGPVNSRHHQAVADPGRLRVSARAEDGLIEAVEAPGDGFCIGVQWHPETLAGPHRERLLAAFVRSCAERSRRDGERRERYT